MRVISRYRKLQATDDYFPLYYLVRLTKTIRLSFFVENGDAFKHSFLRELEDMQVVVPPRYGVVLGEQILAEVYAASEDDGVELSILDS